MPAGNGLLYVQPIYTQRASTSGSGTYPQLQFVLASFGDQVGIGQTLEEALADRTRRADRPTPAEPPDEPGDEPPDEPGDEPPTWGRRAAVELLRRADAAYTRALDAYEAGDLGEYQDQVELSNRLTERALDILLGERRGEEQAPPADRRPHAAGHGRHRLI